MPRVLGPSAKGGIIDQAPSRPEGDNSERQAASQPLEARNHSVRGLLEYAPGSGQPVKEETR